MNIKSSMRIFFYLFIVTAAISLSIYKIGVIKEKNLAVSPSLIDEYANNGIPITIYQVTRKKFIKEVSVTGKVKSKNSIEVEMSFSKIKKIGVGNSAKIIIGEKTIFGKVISVSQKVSLETGLYSAFIASSSSINDFIGENVNANIILSSSEKKVIIPRSSVLISNNKQYVYKVVDGVAHKKWITTVDSNYRYQVVSSGVRFGDKVVNVGKNYVHEGLKILDVSLN